VSVARAESAQTSSTAMLQRLVNFIMVSSVWTPVLGTARANIMPQLCVRAVVRTPLHCVHGVTISLGLRPRSHNVLGKLRGRL